MARLIETDTFTNKDISAAVAIGAYTSTATRLVHVRVAVDQAAGNGDYIIYATLQIAGTGSSYRIIPITTAAAASGVTALMFVSLGIPMDNTDVLTVYIDGLAGDTSTPDTRVDFYEKDYLRPTITGRTLDVSATGEAGMDFDNVKAATGATTLTNITVPVVTTLTNMPAEAPSAATIAAEILLTPANKLATGAAGVVTPSGGSINSVLGTVSAQLVDGVVHGGTTAELTLKNAVLSNLDNQGIALSLRGGNPASPGHAIALLDENGTLGTGRIRGYIDGVVNGVALATEAITGAAFDATGLQAVADAGLLAPSAGTPATGSMYDLLIAPASEPAQLDWRAWTTPDGALKDLYDDNAIDVLTGLPSDYAATDGAEYFGSYVMREFDGSLFVGISNLPMNGTGAIIARLDTPGGTPVFEYNLPEEGVSCMAVNPAGTALYATGVDVRDNTERCGFYKRDLAGTWTRRNTLRLYPSEDGFQHVTGIVFVGSRIYVCGQAIDTAIAWSDDDGITWNYSSHVTPRAYSIGAIGTQLYVLGSYDGALYYELARETEPGWADYTNPISTQLGVAKNQMVNWGDYLLFGVDTDELISVDAAGTVVSHSLPFVLRQTYNNLAVDTDGYLCVLGTTGVWRTNDLATWKQVWSFSPADTVRSIGTWGDNLVVSTDGATAQVLARPASPEAAQQQMTRDAMQLAPTVSSFATNSVDYYIDRIANGLTGVGLIPLTYTVTEPNGTTPIVGTTVELYTEEACINCVRRGVTNSFGAITFWLTTAGTYWIKSAKDGYQFELDSETVSA